MMKRHLLHDKKTVIDMEGHHRRENYVVEVPTSVILCPLPKKALAASCPEGEFSTILGYFKCVVTTVFILMFA